MSSTPKLPLGRRRFLKGAAAGAAALVAKAAPGSAAEPQAAAAAPRPGTPPSTQLSADTEPPRRSAARIIEHPGVGLHARRHQEHRLRVRRRQPGIELRRAARIDHQLRREQGAGAADVLPRGVVGRHGARLRQDRRQADACARARQHRPPARVDGDLQRLRRSRAGVHHRRQLSRRRHARQRRELVPQCPGHGADRARLREMGRRAGLACRRSPNRRSAPTRLR